MSGLARKPPSKRVVDVPPGALPSGMRDRGGDVVPPVRGLQGGALLVTRAPPFPAATTSDPVVGSSKPRPLGILAPGLITGASDDDLSGIATYSQAGAQTCFALVWLMPLTYPLMAVTQEISARGHTLAGNIRRHYPAWVAHSCIALLLIANAISAPTLARWAMWCTCWPVVRRGSTSSVSGGCVVAQIALTYTRCIGAEVADAGPLRLFRHSGDRLRPPVRQSRKTVSGSSGSTADWC